MCLSAMELEGRRCWWPIAQLWRNQPYSDNLRTHLLQRHWWKLPVTGRRKSLTGSEYFIKKGKGTFYIAQYPVRWTAQSALHFFASPGRPVHSDTNSASPGSILARQQLRAKAKSLTFPPLSIARYSFIQLSEQGRQWRERKCPIFETVTKRDSNPGSLDCESGILPLSYRAHLWDILLHQVSNVRLMSVGVWKQLLCQ